MPQTGTVALWLNHKGIGFITPDAGGDDYLVHFSEIQGDAEAFRSLAKGEKVEFELKADEKNPEKMVASKVTGPGGAAVQGKAKGKKKGESGEEKKKKKEKKGEEKKEAPGKGKKKGKGEAVAPADEKRIDPEDGKACTWEEMFAKYKKTFKKPALVEYWEGCKLAKKKAGKGAKKGEAVASPDEKRIDPEDGAACTWEEMFAKYKKTYVKDNGRDALVEYWKTCKKAGKKAGGKGAKKGDTVAPADEKRVDPEDGAACTWEEMFTKYKKTYVRENGRDALVEYWNTCKLAGKKKAGGKGGKKGRKAGA